MENGRPLTGDDEAARKELHEVVELLKTVDTKTGEGRETQEKLMAVLESINEKLSKPATGRKGEFHVGDADLGDNSGENFEAKMLGELLKQPATQDEIRHFHKVNDEMYILSTLLGVKDPLRQTKYGATALKQLPMLRKALDTAAGSGTYIPTGFSSSLHEQVRLQFRVAALHDRINMPQDPYKLPIEGADATAYLVNERGGADDWLTAGNLVTASFSSSSPGFTAVTLTSKKIGARLAVSTELDEDSIIPVLPYMRNKLSMAMAEAQEDATINGDTAGTFDASTPGAAATRGWDGYRKTAYGAAAAVTVSNSASATTSVALADIRTLRARMGKYGVDPSRLAIVTGPVGYIKMLAIQDTQAAGNPSPVLTVDKMGPNATILSGQLASIDGIPIIVSPKVREDLNAFGKFDGVTVDRTIIQLVNRDGFVYGDRRQATLKSREIIETDQTALVVMQRVVMAAWFGTAPVVGTILNIQR
jgi:HK97 family phage major capsid protein